MTAVAPVAPLHSRLPLSFAVDAAHSASVPPEARGLARDAVRLLVSRGDTPPVHARFTDLPQFLDAGDLLVVNTSATVAAAADAATNDGHAFVIHVSTELPGGLWMVEPRARRAGGATAPLVLESHTTTVRLQDGTRIDLLRPVPGSHRLWLATVEDDVDLRAQLRAVGRVIRYSYVLRDWPLDYYQTVFAVDPGSAEMPSAARPFSPDLVTRLVTRGVTIAPITLHTGVSSLEGHELPYPEHFDVPEATATLVNAVREHGGRVVAVGTTVVRALESAVDHRGHVHEAHGWTDIVVTPERGTRAIDGLITGWHEPDASHLAMLEAVAGADALTQAYEAAFAAGYLWHEFGDSHLLLPYAGH